MQLHKILFPIDFSERSRAAAPFVQSMARRHGATVTLLHAVPPMPPIYFDMCSVYPEAFAQLPLSETLLARLREFADEQFPHMEVACSVVDGEPARAIVDFAKELKADLIALPTHGYGLFRRALLGSVTAKVLHDSPIPVWTSAHACDPSHRAHPQPRLIVAAIDLKVESEHALEVALSLAQVAGATVEILHVTAEKDISAASAGWQVERTMARAAAASSIGLSAGQPVEVQMTDETDSIASVVRRTALLKRADLVVIGRGAVQGHLLERFHANAYSVICESPCPVLSV